METGERIKGKGLTCRFPYFPWTDYILIWKMHNRTNYSHPFRVTKIQREQPDSSIFCSPYIYMAPHSLKKLGLSWGQTVSISNFKFGESKMVRSFVLINQTLKHDELIISKKVAKSLELTNCKLDLILVFPQDSGENFNNQIVPPELNIQETLVKRGHKNLFPEPNFVYCRKENYELMAFISNGMLKLQIKTFLKKQCLKTGKLFQASDFKAVDLTHQQILECLEDSKSHQLFLELGIIVIRDDKSEGRTYQIQLKEVPHFYSFDTEMLMTKMQERREMTENSYVEGNKSRSILKAETDRDASIAQSPNIGVKSVKTSETKASTNSNFLFQGGKTEYLKLKKKGESDSHIPKNIRINHEKEPTLKALEQKMHKMEDQIKFLRESCDKNTKKADRFNRKMDQLNQETNQKLNAIVKQDWLAIQNVKKNMETMHREFSQSSDYTKNMMKKSFIEMDKKLKDISLNCSRFSSSGLAVEKDDREGEQSSISIPISPKIDKESNFLNQYKVSDNFKQLITREGKSEWTQLLTTNTLQYSSKTAFSLKILRSKFNFIMVGIVDKKRIDCRSSWTQDHCLAYCGWNSMIYVSGQPAIDNALIFKEGGQIMMEVEPEKGLICWCLQGIRYSKKSRLLRNSEIQWVPYIEMFTPGDVVEWQ